MLYRIYTEDKNRERVVELAASHFEAFTVFTGTGYWRGKAEQSLIIEAMAIGLEESEANLFEAKVMSLAFTIRKMNSQECVLVTSTEQAEVFI